MASGSYPARPGNRVRPLIDGVPAFRRIGAAVGAARCSVWLTVTFFAPDFRFPDDRGSLFDVLDRACERGLDVRVMFWRPNPESSRYGRTFPGSSADRDRLQARGSRFPIRWDRAPAACCQHQKSWIIDAGQPSETAFVGGINLTAANMGSPGHLGGGRRHDVYVEVTGPSATDVHHNFVQRWNEASERRIEDGVWGHSGADVLPFPERLSEPRGASVVQIQRMVPPGRYTDGRPTPGSGRYDISAGERSILDQYKQSIDAARRSIYIENQALPVPEIAIRLEDALRRGVELVFLVPAEPEEHVRTARRNPARKDLFDRVEALGRYENFTLAGISAPDGPGLRSNIYVHSKIMLVDDAWATIGSCNLHASSLYGHTEMNAAFWDPSVVRALRSQLLSEHLGQDTAHLDDRAALRLYRRVAHANGLGAGGRGDNWQGLAFALAPDAYGR
ncbi:MAG TPA: phosphatidylserine/phosphatidylglycerophosphate/cardiolipin synthase family protein [Stellaceae bacterium]|nr:phosphatidylserine/phosphatidylglycerophosphate/cardiolipin synthase family protein [Stellaceae bacterium]